MKTDNEILAEYFKEVCEIAERDWGQNSICQQWLEINRRDPDVLALRYSAELAILLGNSTGLRLYRDALRRLTDKIVEGRWRNEPGMSVQNILPVGLRLVSRF